MENKKSACKKHGERARESKKVRGAKKGICVFALNGLKHPGGPQRTLNNVSF